MRDTWFDTIRNVQPRHPEEEEDFDLAPLRLPVRTFRGEYDNGFLATDLTGSLATG